MRHTFRHILYLFSVYSLGLCFFSAIRLALLFSQWEQTINLPDTNSLLRQALWMGIRFDTVISCYILLLPLFALLLASIFGWNNRIPAKICTTFIAVLYGIALFLCIADIPYFAEFFKHINAVFNWED